MSYEYITKALQAHLEAMSVTLPTAWPGLTFTAPATAYQRVNMLPAETRNPEMGSLKRESGVMQVRVCYPVNSGPIAPIARAELIRTQFKKGTTLTNGGVTVRIMNDPSIAPQLDEPGIIVVPVSIPYQADI